MTKAPWLSFVWLWGENFQCESVVKKLGYLSLSPSLCGYRQGLPHLSFIIFEMGTVVFVLFASQSCSESKMKD